MICKHCETENPEGAVFCLHCGKRLDGKKFCPSCKSLCPEEALYCNACGARLVEVQSSFENEKTQPAQTEYTKSPVPAAKEGTFEKVKSAFNLSGGICLMVAVLFAFVFTFCIGLTATASGSSLGSSVSQTVTMWRYFGDAYKDIAEAFERLDSYSAYMETATYIPVVLSTIICAGTLLSVFILTIIAAVKYGRHFKNPEIKYAKYAVAAVLSFVLGATAFLAVNSASGSVESQIKVLIHFSAPTTAGIVLSVLFLWLYCVSRIVMLGKEFATKRNIVNFVCTLAGIVFAVFVVAFAASPSMVFKEIGSRSNRVGLNFSVLNTLLAQSFETLNSETELNFIITYVSSTLAQFVQIALLVLAFILIIKRVSGLGNDSKSCLGISIAIFILAAVMLALTCVAIGFGNKLMSDGNSAEFTIGAGPIVALIFSVFAFADAITHKVLLRKITV